MAPGSAATLDRFEAAVLFAIREASQTRVGGEISPMLTPVRPR